MADRHEREAATDETVLRAMSGDAAACGDLWRCHRRFVGAVLLAHMPRQADLDDLLQEVAVRVCEGIRQLRDPKSLTGWLRIIAINTARSDARARRAPWRHAEPLTPENGDPIATRDAETARDRETVDHVLARVRALPRDYREPLLLKAVDGLSQREIAAALGVPETTIETRLARARRMLRSQLEAETNEGESEKTLSDRCLQ